ncbi:hypothetical protein [uncultured Vagococcus sp.]|uniref:hypothetical protein n=1 Tax=uncultured Vagococcus sp. TaxID=189676 RepID=UPI0028D1D88B|nr:hypothetical protein [uncultured Vagococcus sp.]
MKQLRKSYVPILILLISFFCLFPLTGHGAELEDSYLTYQEDGEFQLQSEDLLAKFKGVMPGDKVRQKLIVKNDSNREVEISLSVVSTNPVDLAFLEQLGLTLRKGRTILYSGKIHQMTEKSGTELGKFQVGQEEVFDLDLEVPLSLDNTYNGYLTTSEWSFVATDSGAPVKPEPSKPKPTPQPIPPKSVTGGKLTTAGYHLLPQMGASRNNWQLAGLLVLALTVLVVGKRIVTKLG